MWNSQTQSSLLHLAEVHFLGLQRTKPSGQEGVVVAASKKTQQYTFIGGKTRVWVVGSNLAGRRVRITWHSWVGSAGRR